MSDEKVVLEGKGVRVLADGTCLEQWPDGEWRETLNDSVPGMLARALAESEAKRVEAEALAEERDNARAQQAQRVRDAEADNAALVLWISQNGHHIGTMACPHTGGYSCEPGCVAHGVYTQRHPGAALLERVARLEAAWEALHQTNANLTLDMGGAVAHLRAALKEIAESGVGSDCVAIAEKALGETA